MRSCWLLLLYIALAAAAASTAVHTVLTRGTGRESRRRLMRLLCAGRGGGETAATTRPA
jgi:hypothetical protein